MSLSFGKEAVVRLIEGFYVERRKVASRSEADS